ncbi:fumarate hydratase [Candidatus Proelusimicrobium volucris]|uniref:fumarate hydratase n=1 Tax=Candidatus Proelusimicrobium volucris TaxID=3416225 RepID=UPI003D145A40
MRIIKSAEIRDMVASLCIEAAYNLPKNEIKLLRAALNKEKGRAANLIRLILKNAKIASKGEYPLCQDTGSAVIFAEIGEKVHIEGNINEAVNEGVRKGYKEGYLRKSIVSNPLFDRKNSGDNTPAILHLSIVKGDRIKLKVLLKGGGAENASRLKMFTPADGKEEIISFIKQSVKDAGGKACPPYILGVGIGGDFEQCAFLAKKALTRSRANSKKSYALLEEDILREVNSLGIGAQGLGGKVTALAVYVESAPCHMASLPVALNICCHSHRIKGGVI